MSKQIFRAVLGAAVIIGIAALCAGCPTEGGGGGTPYNPGGGTDTWSNVTSLSQLNGTWKGAISGSGTNALPVSNGQGGITYEMLPMTASGETTLTINANAKTLTAFETGTVAYSGEKIATLWNDLKNNLKSMENSSNVTTSFAFNDANHSYTYTLNLTVPFTTDKEIAGFLSATSIQINQGGKKIRIPNSPDSSGFTVGAGAVVSEEILTKQ